MGDKLNELFVEWSKSAVAPTDFQLFQGGFTFGAVSMRARAQELAQKKKGNELVNAIGSLPDIPD
jgi:hypothetical protein